MTPKPKDPIKDIIENSGNNHHYQVVEFLREKGWTVLVSPYYNDKFTDKPREVDIIAEKPFDIKEWGTWFGTLNVKLFIECKYITKPTVFWFDKKDMGRAIERMTKDTSISVNNTNIQKLHYYTEKNVAKLFSSSPEKNLDNELFFKAISQSINALMDYRGGDSIIQKSDPHRKINIIHTISYPVILCNSFSNLYRVDTSLPNGYISISDNFQMEVNYAYRSNITNSSVYEYFILDMVSFDKLDDFLKNLEESDIKTISEYHAHTQGVQDFTGIHGKSGKHKMI
jgi:hypothetical protein